MSEYIKREDAERAIEEDFRHACHPYEWMGLEDALDDLSHVPSADVVEVVHGRWIRESVGSDNSSDGYFKISMAECSECGTCVMGKPNYCPNCGARMDGGARA